MLDTCTTSFKLFNVKYNAEKTKHICFQSTLIESGSIAFDDTILNQVLQGLNLGHLFGVKKKNEQIRRGFYTKR